jgi:predicted alpha/beta superfamily hydrolase
METSAHVWDKRVPIANSELHHLHSAATGRDFEIKVRLPENYYSSDERYPVLYMPDGDFMFAMTTDIVQYLIYGANIPDLIVVSPAYGSKSRPDQGGTNMRDVDLMPFPREDNDYKPGGPAFLTFLEHELIPFAEQTFRIDPANRTFFGGGAVGGFIVLASLFRNPRLFNTYIAAQGFVEDVLELEEEYARKHRALPARLLLMDANEHFAPLVARLNSRNYDRLTLAYERITVPVVFAEPPEAVTKALLWAFAQSERAVG